MLIQEVQFDRLEFEGADGEIHFLRQCSLADREELRERFKQLTNRLSTAAESATVGDLYDQDKMFRWWVNRALELCGVQTHWVSIEQMMALLFAHQDEQGKPRSGWLIALNFPRLQQEEQPQGRKPQTYEEVIATISTYCESLTEALSLARNHPAGELNDILKAKAEIAEQQRRATDPEYAKRVSVKEKQRKAKARWQELREAQRRGQQT
jgi:hypothetical protein